MPQFPVSKSKLKDLETKMQRLGIKEENLVETFVRGSGPGGQKINKTSVAVILKDPQRGIEVRCQKERSQALNRFIARRLLVEKIENLELKIKTEVCDPWVNISKGKPEMSSEQSLIFATALGLALRGIKND